MDRSYRLLFRLFVLVLTGSSAMAGPAGITKEGGAAQARKDLAVGKKKVLVAGGEAIFAPGVPNNDPRFARLPREKVPCGCTVPHAAEWFEYATGYNAVVVERVRRGTPK